MVSTNDTKSAITLNGSEVEGSLLSLKPNGVVKRHLRPINRGIFYLLRHLVDLIAVGWVENCSTAVCGDTNLSQPRRWT